MNTLSTGIFNSSKDQEIYIKLSSSEDANIPSDSGIIVYPRETKKIAVQGSTMNMFVYEMKDKKETKSLIWKGIVPTNVNKNLIIIPESKKVFYEGIDLPDNFRPSTNFEEPGFFVSNKKNYLKGFYFVLFVLLVILILGFLWYKGFLSFSKKMY